VRSGGSTRHTICKGLLHDTQARDADRNGLRRKAMVCLFRLAVVLLGGLVGRDERQIPVAIGLDDSLDRDAILLDGDKARCSFFLILDGLTITYQPLMAEGSGPDHGPIDKKSGCPSNNACCQADHRPARSRRSPPAPGAATRWHPTMHPAPQLRVPSRDPIPVLMRQVAQAWYASAVVNSPDTASDREDGARHRGS